MSAHREGIEDAKAKGASIEFLDALQTILEEKVDVFRLALGGDPPVYMPPMRIKLKSEATPVRCRARRYSSAHREFLARHVKMLLDAGLCYRNPSSQWCSPPHIVPKGDDHRMTVDVREANKRVVPVVWPMPILEVEFDRLRGMKFYFSLDFFKGFWQFAAAVDCQEIYSILTEDGVITPTRVLMGGTNSVAYVQSTVQAMFGDLFNNGLLIWIDDLLGYADSPEELLRILLRVLTICEEMGLKLNPKKCKFFMAEALWCGRIVSGEGVRHDPARIQALRELPAPSNGQELQQFICALNWMRMSLPAFNKLVYPLSLFMEKVYAAAGGRKKSLVRRVTLRAVGWSDVELAALQRCKEALEHALTLAHPDPEKRLCVFTDASDEHWGAAITQVPQNHLHRDFADQHHEPLMMLTGTLSGGAIVEKEAYAIVETCKRADYLVRRPDGFSLFTDHRNLRYIFAPTAVSSAVPKYTADKLHRWSLLLMSLEYEIHDIAGDANVWAYLLSRWGSAFTTVAAIRLTSLPVSPQLDENFDWSTAEHIQAAQNSATDIPLNMQAGPDKVLRDCDGRVWLPDDA
ncbi:hypothetical protein PR003_g3818 [Phytophthora rubi]|uniref:Reverse transcriptase domain-containing protein n=1 Tax=Phytophthora rubi TaxID=129364 RepID=A0A6A4G026_9STRA|nr:hypothetical protein PR003_g3818 [Phytophthora rubi]